MKNWMLVCCYERDIEEPRFFETYEEAYKQMRMEFLAMLDWKEEELEEMLIEYDDECGLVEMAAWAERHGNNCDWKIFNLTEIEERI